MQYFCCYVELAEYYLLSAHLYSTCQMRSCACQVRDVVVEVPGGGPASAAPVVVLRTDTLTLRSLASPLTESGDIDERGGAASALEALEKLLSDGVESPAALAEAVAEVPQALLAPVDDPVS